MSAPLFSAGGYTPGHPWYYRLGGRPLTPKQIIAEVKHERYRGYLREEIALAESRCEPRRSQELRQLRKQTLERLRFDLSGYRRAVRTMRSYAPGDYYPICSDPFLSVGLKHSHLFNDFAHLVWLDELLAVQPDLFEC